MNDYCAANPDSLVIPGAVTRCATVYTWKCSNGTAAVDTQFTELAVSGFLAAYWYKISPPGGPPRAVPTTGAARSSMTQLLVTLSALSLLAGRALRRGARARRE